MGGVWSKGDQRGNGEGALVVSLKSWALILGVGVAKRLCGLFGTRNDMEVSDSVVLGVFGVCLVYYVTHSIKRIEVILLDHAEKINEISLPELNIEGIASHIENLVEEMFENINLPSAGDMAMQMGLQFIAQKFGIGPGSIPFVEDELESDVDILQPPSE